VRFHALLIVRDEGDIIAQTLAHLLSWCDVVHVFDSGSIDETYDIVQSFAQRETARVVPFGSQRTIFSPTHRAKMFEALRHTFSPGDWIARVDADEFFHMPPPVFVRERVRWPAGRIFARHYEFVMTRGTYAHLEADAHAARTFASDIQKHSRVYMPDRSMWYETRLVKFRRGMRWGKGQPVPFDPGLPAFERIPVRHYRWRSPQQMLARLRLRMIQAKLDEHGDHWMRDRLDQWLCDDNDPRLRLWDGASDLPHFHDLRHLENPRKRVLREVLYRSGLPTVRDLFRAGWPSDEPFPADPTPVHETTMPLPRTNNTWPVA
jgi:Glycosyl transferase family 2